MVYKFIYIGVIILHVDFFCNLSLCKCMVLKFGVNYTGYFFDFCFNRCSMSQYAFKAFNDRFSYELCLINFSNGLTILAIVLRSLFRQILGNRGVCDQVFNTKATNIMLPNVTKRSVAFAKLSFYDHLTWELILPTKLFIHEQKNYYIDK